MIQRCPAIVKNDIAANIKTRGSEYVELVAVVFLSLRHAGYIRDYRPFSYCNRAVVRNIRREVATTKIPPAAVEKGRRVRRTFESRKRKSIRLGCRIGRLVVCLK